MNEVHSGPKEEVLFCKRVSLAIKTLRTRVVERDAWSRDGHPRRLVWFKLRREERAFGFVE